MTNDISINKYIFTGLLAAILVSGAFGGYYYTNQHYQDKETKELAQEVENDEKNLICEARVQRGKTVDVKSDYFIFERSAEREDCERFIDYKNIPDDTEAFWLGF
jgi:hypothetical protein